MGVTWQSDLIRGRFGTQTHPEGTLGEQWEGFPGTGDGPTGVVNKTRTKRRYYLGSFPANHLFEHLSAQNHVREQ